VHNFTNTEADYITFARYNLIVLHHHTKFHDTTSSDTCWAPTLWVHTVAILV